MEEPQIERKKEIKESTFYRKSDANSFFGTLKGLSWNITWKRGQQ